MKRHTLTMPLVLLFVFFMFSSQVFAAKGDKFDVKIAGDVTGHWNEAGKHVVKTGLELRPKNTEVVVREIELLRIADAQPQFSERQKQIAAIYTRANTLYKNYQFDEALVKYKEVIQYSPKEAWAFRGIINVYAAKQDMADALIYLNTYLKKYPSSAAAHYGQAYAYFLQKNWNASENSCRKALASDANLALAWNQLAVALRAQGRSDEAIAAAQRAIEVEPLLFFPYQNLAFIYQ